MHSGLMACFMLYVRAGRIESQKNIQLKQISFILLDGEAMNDE